MTEICVTPFSHSPLLLTTLTTVRADAVMLDNEHGVIPPDELRAAMAILSPRMRVMVRAEETSVAMVDKYWALGVRSLIMPKVDDLAELSRIVARVRELAGDGYDDYSLVALLEGRDMLDRVADLAAIEGLRTVSIGPYDLSHDMGIADMRGDPVFLNYIEDRLKALAAAGLKVTLYMLPEWLDRFGALPIAQYNFALHELAWGFLTDRGLIDGGEGPAFP